MIRPEIHQFPIPEQPQQHQQPPQQPVNGNYKIPYFDHLILFNMWNLLNEFDFLVCLLEIRIHLQRIPLQRESSVEVREIPVPVDVFQARPNVIRPIQAIRLQSVPEREPQSNFPPREAALLRESFGLTNEDLMNIQRLAQDRIEQELRSLAQEDLSNDSNSSESDDDDNSDENIMGQPINTNAQQQPQTEQPKTDENKRKTKNIMRKIKNQSKYLIKKIV